MQVSNIGTRRSSALRHPLAAPLAVISVAAAVVLLPAAPQQVGAADSFTVSVDAPPAGPVGTAQPFTIDVDLAGGGDPGAVAVDFGWTGPAGSSVTAVNGSPAIGATACTTDAAGVCTVTVSSTVTPGTGALTVTSIGGAPPAAGSVASASTTWFDWRVVVDPAAATAVIGQQQAFGVLLQRNDGTGWVPESAGRTLSFTLSGGATVQEPATTCDDPGTDASGECLVVVTSQAAVTVTVTVTGANVSLPAGSAGPLFPFDVPDTSATATWALNRLTIVKQLDTDADFPSGTFRMLVQRLAADPEADPVAGPPTTLDVVAADDDPGVGVLIDLEPGVYRLTEELANPLVPFRFVSVSCEGAEFASNPAGRYVDVFVGDGADATCTFRNESFNLTMAKTDGGVTAPAGGTFGYTLTVTKQGAGQARASATVTDTLTGGFTWTGTPTGPGATCTVTNAATTLTCVVTAAQLNTGSASIAAQVSVPAAASGPFTNTAVVDSPEDPATGYQPQQGVAPTDPYTLDNTAIETTPVQTPTTTTSTSSSSDPATSAPTTAPATTAPAAASPPTPGLPQTGSGASIRSAALMVAVGLALVLLARRRPVRARPGSGAA